MSNNRRRTGEGRASDQLGRIRTSARSSRVVGSGEGREKEEAPGPDQLAAAAMKHAGRAGSAVAGGTQALARYADHDDEDDLIDSGGDAAEGAFRRPAGWLRPRRSAGSLGSRDGDPSDRDGDGVEDFDENDVDPHGQGPRRARLDPDSSELVQEPLVDPLDEDQLTQARGPRPTARGQRPGSRAPRKAGRGAPHDPTKRAAAGSNLANPVNGGTIGVRGGSRAGARTAGIFARTRSSAGTAKSVSGVGASASRGAAAVARAAQQIAAAVRAIASAVAAFVATTPMLAIIAAVVATVIALISIVSSFIPAIHHETTQQQTGTCGIGTVDMPPEARPWMEKAAQTSGLPVDYLAAIARRESDFRPDIFADDSNGGTWGLFQINRAIWSEVYPQGDNPGGTPGGITDPMIHAEYGGIYFKNRLETVRTMQQNNPDAAYARLPELEALVIAHNAGEGNLQKYPNIPTITQGYLAEVRESFQAGACPPEGEGGGAGGIQPPAGEVLAPWPAELEGSMTSGARYGNYPSGSPHYGYDISGPEGWPIHNICDGTVAAIDINPAYANTNAQGVSGSTNYLWIDCGNNVYMGYAHWYADDLNSDLQVGQEVGAGTLLATEGNQGNSSGSHLHLQISTVGSTDYSSSVTTDPSAYLDQFGISLPSPGY